MLRYRIGVLSRSQLHASAQRPLQPLLTSTLHRPLTPRMKMEVRSDVVHLPRGREPSQDRGDSISATFPSIAVQASASVLCRASSDSVSTWRGPAPTPASSLPFSCVSLIQSMLEKPAGTMSEVSGERVRCDAWRQPHFPAPGVELAATLRRLLRGATQRHPPRSKLAQAPHKSRRVFCKPAERSTALGRLRVRLG